MNKLNESNLAKNLVALMKSRGITTAKLSQEIAMPEITINKIRNGQNKNPTVGTLLPIIEYFNISLDYLFRNDGVENNSGMTIFNMDGSQAGDVWYPDKHFGVVDFVIRMTCESYSEYKKDSLLLIKKQEVANEDMVIIKLNDCFTPCKIIIECRTLTCKSLIYPDKYYQINANDILGVIVGTIWKRN